MNPFASELSQLFAAGAARLHVIAYHSDPRGVARIQSSPYAHGAVAVKTICRLEESDKAFSDASRVFKDASRRSQFRDFCLTIGSQLAPASPLGWGDCQWCVSYDYTIPDNSLPILSVGSNKSTPWLALFPRRR
jgi:hypothetical protein